MNHEEIPQATRNPVRGHRDNWKCVAIGIFALGVTSNCILYGALDRACEHYGAEVTQLQTQLQQTEAVRDDALKELGTLALSFAQEKRARQEQAEAYEALGAYQYAGEFIITAYCPCEKCCGRWADGITATGIPVSPGIVAVDPEVIPLGSTIIVDGQKYLAADTGVEGRTVDIFLSGHDDAARWGSHRADVWLVKGAQP